MWNRPEEESASPQPEPTDAPTPRSKAPTVASGQPAVLGPSIKIKGTLSGDEDLLIEGRVDGEVSFKKHTVTVGKSGRIKADLTCKNIYVEGQVNGNLYGEDVVVIKESGQVNGNAVAPRVSLEDGCHFHGAIDMQPKQKVQTSATRESKAPMSNAKEPSIKKPENAPVSAGRNA